MSRTSNSQQTVADFIASSLKYYIKDVVKKRIIDRESNNQQPPENNNQLGIANTYHYKSQIPIVAEIKFKRFLHYWRANTLCDQTMSN